MIHYSFINATVQLVINFSYIHLEDNLIKSYLMSVAVCRGGLCW